MVNGNDIVSSDAKWIQEIHRVFAQINYITPNGNDGGIVCSMRADDFGNFEQMPLFMKSRQMRDLLVRIYNENKAGYRIINEIAELLGSVTLSRETGYGNDLQLFFNKIRQSSNMSELEKLFPDIDKGGKFYSYDEAIHAYENRYSEIKKIQPQPSKP